MNQDADIVLQGEDHDSGLGFSFAYAQSTHLQTPLEWSWPSHLSAPLQAQPLQLKIMCADEHASAGGIVQINQTLGHLSADGFHAGTRRHP